MGILGTILRLIANSSDRMLDHGDFSKDIPPEKRAEMRERVRESAQRTREAAEQIDSHKY